MLNSISANLRAAISARGKNLPRYIVVEGPIGVGKTKLTRQIAELLSYQILLESPADNPFLSRFYSNRRQGALPTQLFFLFERARQMETLKQEDLFDPMRVANFIMDKDRLFASLTLDNDELALYENVYDHLNITAPEPELVIYLQAPVDVLLQRISARGIDYEQRIEESYLVDVAEAYTRFFHYYDRSPLLIVNAGDIDLAGNHADFEALMQVVLTTVSGRHYYNPRTRAI